MDIAGVLASVGQQWKGSIVERLSAYVRIPNKSPLFDPDWEKHGYMEQAANRLVDDLPHGIPDLRPGNGAHVPEELVHHEAEAEDVALRRRRGSGDLLGRQIRGGADRQPAARQPRRRLQRLGNTEVHDLRLATGEDPDVGGLDVAVDDTVVVGRRQATRNVDEPAQLLGGRAMSGEDFHRAAWNTGEVQTYE